MATRTVEPLVSEFVGQSFEEFFFVAVHLFEKGKQTAFIHDFNFEAAFTGIAAGFVVVDDVCLVFT